MFVKTFEAPSMEEALALVKREMGPEALIVSTEHKKVGLLRAPTVLLTAAYEKKSEAAAQDPFSDEKLSEIFPHRKAEIVQVEKASFDNYRRVLPKAPQLKPSGFEKNLVARGFLQESAREISNRLAVEYSREDLKDSDFQEKAQVRIISEPIRALKFDALKSNRSWVLLGPPGSGKTSVAVKLALYLRGKGEPASLISLDDRKISARGEMAAYAHATGIPFQNATSFGQGGNLIQLVDTAALGPNDDKAKIRKMCEGKGVLIVLDARERLEELLHVLAMTKDFRPQGIVLTHFDLLQSYGIVYDLLKMYRIPFLGASVSDSFRTNFRFFEPKEFASLILKGPSTV